MRDLSYCAGPDDEETVLPLVAMNTKKGCTAGDIITDVTPLVDDEMCVCEEQTDLLFWVSLFSQFSKKCKSRFSIIPLSVQ